MGFSKLRGLLLVVFSLVLLVPSTAYAQEADKDKAKKEIEKQQELERKALGLLDEVATQALGLKLAENRSFILVSAADLLWTHDEKRARNMFWQAFSNLPSMNFAASDAAKGSASKNSTAKETPSKDATAKDKDAKLPANIKAQDANQYFAAFSIRKDFLFKVAARDPQLALDMLRSTPLFPPDEVNADHIFPDDRDLEQEIVTQAAARDPKRALQMARENLAKGITFQSWETLLQLNQNSPDAALEFAGDIIGKIQTADVGKDQAAFWLAINLLRIARTRGESAVLSSSSARSVSSVKLTDEQKRELVETLADAALSVSTNSDYLAGLDGVMPEIEQFVPDLADKVKAKIASRTLTPQEREWQDASALFRNGTPEEMIRAAATAKQAQRDSLHQIAVTKAVNNGDGDALRKFINDEGEDPAQKKALNELLDTQQMYWRLNQGDIEDAQKLLPAIQPKEKRAQAMARLALLLEKNGKHDDAVKILDQAQALVKVDISSQSQSDALLAVLLAYTIVDPDKAFVVIEPIIDHANDSIAKLILVDKLVKSGYVKDSEIKLQHSGNFSIDSTISRYGDGLVSLANSDFIRTKALADRIQRNELRVAARLMLVQTLLRKIELEAKKTAQTTP